MGLRRTPTEVAEILTLFIDGEPTGHGADKFLTIPIHDPVLDQIREDFERLVERVGGQWEPQMPFPKCWRDRTSCAD